MRPCPICDRNAPAHPENPSAPFCSERCRMIDLGQWLDEGYRIAEPVSLVDEEMAQAEDGT